LEKTYIPVKELREAKTSKDLAELDYKGHDNRNKTEYIKDFCFFRLTTQQKEKGEHILKR